MNDEWSSPPPTLGQKMSPRACVYFYLLRIAHEGVKVKVDVKDLLVLSQRLRGVVGGWVGRWAGRWGWEYQTT